MAGENFPVTDAQIEAWMNDFDDLESIAVARSATQCPLATAARRYGHEIRVGADHWMWASTRDKPHNFRPRLARFIGLIDAPGTSHTLTARAIKAAWRNSASE